jgi:hypothetical protein
MSVIQIGLVDTTGALEADLVQSVAAALNIQITRDLPQFWSISATVIYLPSPHKVPAGVLAGSVGEIAAAGRRRVPSGQAQAALRKSDSHSEK